ncbi:MAG: hypothetical protein WCO84_06705 [bacterium]
MHEEQEIFTITLITDGEDSKLLLSTGETPAKEDSEASGVIYKEDLPEQFEEIVSKINVFKIASEEDGNEESITHSVQEFLDLYDLDLIDVIEQGEEILHVDLDDDEDSESEEEHPANIFDGDDSDLRDYDDASPDPFAIYGNDEPPSEEDALSHIDPGAIF